MTDSEKLDLILEKISFIEKDVERISLIEKEVEKINFIEKEVNGLKRQLIRSNAELKAMDEMILDEVERVHHILDKHKEDKTVHTA